MCVTWNSAYLINLGMIEELFQISTNDLFFKTMF